ncbi:MAG: SUMF1/EgtB/PvdO family nonheme iron enzyme [Planctomycetota bacterium]
MRPHAPLPPLILVSVLLVGEIAAAGEDTEVAPAPTIEGLVYLSHNGHGAEEWYRVRDGMTVIRVPGGVYKKRPYEGWEATEEPKAQMVAAFLIDKYEVTNEQFARFLSSIAETTALIRTEVGGVVRGADGWRAESGRERHPVTAATGHGAVAYSKWAGAGLPTPLQWEKAAGGPEGRLYPWGDEAPGATRANFGRPTPRDTAPVGSYEAGASYYGCLDMAGNAYERCFMRRGDKALPVMIKGGSWLSPHPLNLRVLDLCVQPMGVAEKSVGFRCVMTDPEPDRKPIARAVKPKPLRIARTFEAAVKEAKRRRVPIFLSLLYDTCGQCDRTREQLYKDPRFVAYCNEHMVVAFGHQAGHAMECEHAQRPDGDCALYPGITCDEHEILFARGMKVVGGFVVSPGQFVLHPDRVAEAAGAKCVLIPERELPKWGDPVAEFLAAFERASRTVGE